MVYNKEAIHHLTELVGGNEEARLWLVENNFPELILLYYALNDYDDALRELIKKKHVELTAFAHAVRGDARAANWLGENKKYEWAATVSVINKRDRNAEAWLMRNNLQHYVELARAIRTEEENTQADDVFGLLRKFIGMFRGSTKQVIKRKI